MGDMGKYGGRRPTRFNDLAGHPDLEVQLHQAKRAKDPRAAMKILDEAETKHLAHLGVQIELLAEEAQATSALAGVELDPKRCREAAAKAIASHAHLFSDWRDLLAALDGDPAAWERALGRTPDNTMPSPERDPG